MRENARSPSASVTHHHEHRCRFAPVPRALLPAGVSPASGGAGAWPGQSRVGRPGPRVCGSVRRYCGQRAGPQRSGPDGRADRAGRQAVAHQQCVLQRTAAEAGRRAGHRLALRAQGVPVQFGYRGQRSGDQAGTQVGQQSGPPGRQARDRDLPRQLPWTHPGGGHRHRAAQVPGRLRAAARRVSLCGLQRCRRAGSGHGLGRCGRGDGRADPGRGRG